MDSRHVQLLRSAADEIRMLRSRNEVLGAQVRVIECFDTALHGRRSEGATVDIAWVIENEIASAEREFAVAKEK
jgi:hypothetical protein